MLPGPLNHPSSAEQAPHQHAAGQPCGPSAPLPWPVAGPPPSSPSPSPAPVPGTAAGEAPLRPSGHLRRPTEPLAPPALLPPRAPCRAVPCCAPAAHWLPVLRILTSFPTFPCLTGLPASAPPPHTAFSYQSRSRVRLPTSDPPVPDVGKAKVDRHWLDLSMCACLLLPCPGLRLPEHAFLILRSTAHMYLFVPPTLLLS